MILASATKQFAPASSIGVSAKEIGSARNIVTRWQTSWGSFDRDYLATRDIEIEIHNLSQLPARIAIDFYFVGRPQRLPTPDKLFSKHSFIVNVAASDQEQLSLRSDASADVGTTVRNSIVTGKRLSLSGRIPRVLSPECLQRGVVAAKNVAFSFSNVGYRFRKLAPRSQIAFTIATVLPHTPGPPGRCIPRLGIIVSDPQPAIRQCLAVC